MESFYRRWHLIRPGCRRFASFYHRCAGWTPDRDYLRSAKGEGGFSEFMMKHKANLSDELTDQEAALHQQRQAGRIAEFLDFYQTIEDPKVEQSLQNFARRMSLELDLSGKKERSRRLLLQCESNARQCAQKRSPMLLSVCRTWIHQKNTARAILLLRR